MKKKRTIFLTISAAAILCCSCTQQITDPHLAVLKQMEIQKRAGFKTGYDTGYAAAKKEIKDALYNNVAMMAALRNYKKLSEENGVSPPAIIAVHKPPNISPDGQNFISGGTEMKIVRPAMFNNPDVLADLTGSQKTWLVTTVDNFSDAEKIIDDIKNKIDTQDKIIILPTEDKRYAVLIKSDSGTDYSEKGIAEGDK